MWGGITYGFFDSKLVEMLSNHCMVIFIGLFVIVDLNVGEALFFYDFDVLMVFK